MFSAHLTKTKEKWWKRVLCAMAQKKEINNNEATSKKVKDKINNSYWDESSVSKKIQCLQIHIEYVFCSLDTDRIKYIVYSLFTTSGAITSSNSSAYLL